MFILSQFNLHLNMTIHLAMFQRPLKTQIKKKKNADIVDIEKSLDIINKYTEQYQKQITNVASIINRLSRFVPSRRKRKLHIGLLDTLEKWEILYYQEQ